MAHDSRDLTCLLSACLLAPQSVMTLNRNLDARLTLIENRVAGIEGGLAQIGAASPFKRSG